MNHDARQHDTELDRALAALPRTRTPSPAFTDGVVAALRHSRPQVPHPWRVRWLAAAVAIFAAGIAVGFGAGRVAAHGPVASAPRADTAPVHEVSQVNVPEIGHSEVWY